MPSHVPRGWRVPLLVGAASIPVTLASYQQSSSTLSLSAVVLAGIVAGVWTGGADGVGVRTGFVGGLAVLRPVVDLVAMLPRLSGPPWFEVSGYGVGLAGGALFVLIGLAFSTLLGAVGAHVGGWLARRGGRRRPAGS